MTTVFNQTILYLFFSPLDPYLIQNVRVIVYVNLRVCLALYQLQFNYGISKIYLRVLSVPKNNCQKINKKKANRVKNSKITQNKFTILDVMIETEFLSQMKKISKNYIEKILKISKAFPKVEQIEEDRFLCWTKRFRTIPFNNGEKSQRKTQKNYSNHL